jgi:hypothetical protein
MLGVSAVTVVTVTTGEHFYLFAHQAAGASSARHSLRPLSGERNENSRPRGKTLGEIADSYLAVIASAAKQSILSFCCAMDCFAALAMMLWAVLKLKSVSLLSQLSSPGLTGRPSIPETPMTEPRSRGVLGPPLSRGMTTFILGGRPATPLSRPSYDTQDAPRSCSRADGRPFPATLHRWPAPGSASLL